MYIASLILAPVAMLSLAMGAMAHSELYHSSTARHAAAYSPGDSLNTRDALHEDDLRSNSFGSLNARGLDTDDRYFDHGLLSVRDAYIAGYAHALERRFDYKFANQEVEKGKQCVAGVTEAEKQMQGKNMNDPKVAIPLVEAWIKAVKVVINCPGIQPDTKDFVMKKLVQNEAALKELRIKQAGSQKKP